MAISDFAKEYNDKMFPGYKSKLYDTDPEFLELFDNFTFDEVTNQNDLDDHTKFMSILATLLGCGGIDEFKMMLPAAYNFEVSPVEMKENARPKLKEYLDNLDKYDTIFVGYPSWCGTMPMVLFSFLENYNLESKTIIPFCTNEGSGMGSSEADLRRICKGAKVLDGLSIKGSEASKSEEIVSKWAKQKASL